VPKKMKFSAHSRNKDREYKIEADVMKNYTDFDHKPFEAFDAKPELMDALKD